MADTITPPESQILAALDTASGMLTGEVAKHVSPWIGPNLAGHSRAVRECLLSLQRRGHVTTLDGQKPVCWCLAKRRDGSTP